ncbi:MAG: TonB-dependent receptor [bacterium]|nr:TonB-dependent receptor [bacterium]
MKTSRINYYDFASRIITTGLVMWIPLFLLLSPAPVRAEDKTYEEGIFEVEEWAPEYVVTAARFKQRVEDAPSPVTIISQDEIRESGATTIGDLLRNVPGLEVMQFSPSDYAVGARGQNKPFEEGVLALLNGKSVYTEFNGMVLWEFLDINLTDIKRIEIIRGPGSALYGANAFEAIINIITLSPEDFRGNYASFTAGEGNTYIGSLRHGGQAGRFSYLASAGWDERDMEENRHGISKRIPKGHASLIYRLGEDSALTFDAGGSGGVGKLFYDHMGLIKINSLYQYHSTIGFQKGPLNFSLYWHQLVADLICNNEDILSKGRLIPPLVDVAEGYSWPANMDNQVLDGEAQGSFNLGEYNSVIVGGESRHAAVDSDLIDKYRAQIIWSAYLQHQFKYRRFLTTFLGLRYDYHPATHKYFGFGPDKIFPLIYKFSVISSPLKDHTFRFSIGRAYVNPNVYYLFNDNDFQFNIGTLHMAGNTELKPRLLTSYEGGYQADLFRKLRFKGNFFYNEMTNLWGTSTNIDNLTMIFNNANRQTSLGGEAELEVMVTPWLRGFANYSYAHVRETISTETGGTRERTSRKTPQHKANSGLRLNLDNGLSAYLAVNWVGDTSWPPNMNDPENPGLLNPRIIELGKVDSYLLLNLRVGYAFWKKQAEVGLAAFNLLDNRHLEFPNPSQNSLNQLTYVEKVGRRITGTISIKF